MKKITTNAELKAFVAELQEELETIRSNFPWENEKAYISWLTQTYEYAYNSTRILALTAGRMPLDRTKFSNRFIAHAAEEKGHERLLENDAKSFGLNIKDLDSSPIAKAFHQSLYYWSCIENPVAMFGWVLALEGFAVQNASAIYEVCKEAHGPKATTFLKVHAQEDEAHLEEAFKSIEFFTPEENQMVADTTYQYCKLYGDILLDIQKSTTEQHNKDVA